MNEDYSSDAAGARPSGIWTVAGDRLIIVDGDAPATILVPSESVRLLAVDLPIRSRAKRLQALPFAIEDQIAERPESVHLALGSEISSNRYLVGVVAHAQMERWTEMAEEAGLGHAAMVPDALALPVPPEGHWAVDLGETRATVRAADGTGFALAAPMLRAAWERAGQPPCLAYGDPLPEDMAAPEIAPPGQSRAERLARPALDLRQAGYARQRMASSAGWGRRLAWIIGIGAVAHTVIASADTLMLRSIADRRENDTRALVQAMAPGASLPAEGGISGPVADLIPPPSGQRIFLPLVTRVSGALAPMASVIDVRTMHFEGNQLVLDLDTTDSGVPSRIDAALRSAAIPATVTQGPDGAVRITASAA
ncbi:type II secretion system protein GspL [Stakelama marina]|uniref:General secretion pathway protein GspL n=1 Tax=Stakelama marina TaxID=2826939 RepID=A0A8T4IDG3_9SPHN|nr:type II secretion system protein GspL [Stakelama marina]MBR0551025.1 general secretion pathway protein GspL [Stakelama marina]